MQEEDQEHPLTAGVRCVQCLYTPPIHKENKREKKGNTSFQEKKYAFCTHWSKGITYCKCESSRKSFGTELSEEARARSNDRHESNKTRVCGRGHPAHDALHQAHANVKDLQGRPWRAALKLPSGDYHIVSRSAVKFMPWWRTFKVGLSEPH